MYTKNCNLLKKMYTCISCIQSSTLFLFQYSSVIAPQTTTTTNFHISNEIIIIQKNCNLLIIMWLCGLCGQKYNLFFLSLLT